MLSKTYSYGITGLDAYPITIEVDVAGGLPATIIVGLPDNAVKESKERVRSAIKNSGYEYPLGRITVNLSPADVKKEGPSFDLAIALGILGATEQIDTAHFRDFAILGELSLDGNIRPVPGILSVVLAASRHKLAGVILPVKNAKEAAISEKDGIFPMTHLTQAVHFLAHPSTFEPYRMSALDITKNANRYDIDFNEVKGQTHVKRGLEIAAAGGHNVLPMGTQYDRRAGKRTDYVPNVIGRWTQICVHTVLVS